MVFWNDNLEKKRSATPRDAPFSSSAVTAPQSGALPRHRQDSVRPLLIGLKMYPSLLLPPHPRLPATHPPFSFFHDTIRKFQPSLLRTWTLIILKTCVHKLPHPHRTCANTTTTYARVGCTSAEYREQVDAPTGAPTEVSAVGRPLCLWYRCAVR